MPTSIQVIAKLITTKAAGLMSPTILAVSAIVVFVLGVSRVVYRIFFHPLKRYPGPKVAAATTLYRAWFQIVHDGGQLRQWNKLHEEYGSIVRIAPNQLHFSHPGAFDEITNFTSPFTKDDEFWYFTGQKDALLGMSDEEQHKGRFKLVASLFSSKGMKMFEPMNWNNTRRLCELLGQAAGRPVNMALAFRALMLDNTLDFVFGETSPALRGLQDLSFSSQYLSTTYEWMDRTGTWPRRNFPRLLSTVVAVIPERLYKSLLPGDHTMGKFFQMTVDCIKERLAAPKSERDCFLSRFSGEHSLDYLTLECTATILGGIVDATNILQYGLFHICTDKSLQEQLQREVDSVWPQTSDSVPETSVLQKLPLLSGVIMETLRLTHGVVAGPPRTSPPGGAMLGGVMVPEGTSVATSSYYPHMNSAIFYSTEKFLPSRWLDATEEMTKSISAFSKGRRQCPARQMAMNQLYIAFAAVLHQFRFEVHETTIEDFEMKAYLSVHFAGRQFHAIPHPRHREIRKDQQGIEDQEIDSELPQSKLRCRSGQSQSSCE